MRPLRLLHQGYDRLEMSFQTALGPDDIELLEAARLEAEKGHCEVLAEIGPGRFSMLIASAGLLGGYSFRGDTGPLGEIWAFKKGLAKTDWNVRVIVRSLSLAMYGFEGVRNRLREATERMGLVIGSERVSRVDYAVDYLMPGEFTLEPEAFVTHSRSTKREISSLPSARKGDVGGSFVMHWSGRERESLTIGKMPGQQLIIYDKRREITRGGKGEWFEIWGIDPKRTDLAVWRIEVRAGKKHLRNWNVRTMNDIGRKAGEIFLGTIEATVVNYHCRTAFFAAHKA